MTDREKIIWAAGFIDGEGYISITRGTMNHGTGITYRVEISAAQVNPEPIDMLASIFGGEVRVANNRCGPYYYWRRYSQKAIPVIRELLPYLVAKRQQATLTLEYAALIDIRGRSVRYIHQATLEKKAALFAAMKALNKRRDRVERLSERARSKNVDATVRPPENKNPENQQETAGRLRVIA